MYFNLPLLESHYVYHFFFRKKKGGNIFLILTKFKIAIEFSRWIFVDESRIKDDVNKMLFEKIKEREEKNGRSWWFCRAGVMALSLSFFLFPRSNRAQQHRRCVFPWVVIMAADTYAGARPSYIIYFWYKMRARSFIIHTHRDITKMDKI